MADKHYTITLRREGGEVDDDSPVAGSTKESTAKGNATAKALVKGMIAYNTYVKPFVQPIIEQQIGTISLRTGASEQQQRIQFAYEIAQSVVGIGTSIVSGFAVGNVPGAVVGAVIGVASTVINYANKAQKIQYEQNLEDVSLRGLSVRAGGYAPGYSGSRGRNQ